MARSELIVIADDRGRSSLPIAITHSSTVIDCFDAARLGSLNGTAVLIDVDLQNFSKVKSLKDNLAARTLGQCRMIAVERGNHFCEVQANGLGASDLLKRPIDLREVRECLSRHKVRRDVKEDPAESEAALAREAGGLSIISASAALDHVFKGLTSGGPIDQSILQQAGDQVLDAIAQVGLAQWLTTVRRYHESTFQHCLTVTGVITAFGHKTGMRKADILTLTTAGLLHDIGKAEVPLTILDKPGKLTDEEFAVVKTHPVIGYEYVRAQGAVGTDVLSAIRHHHEYLDGSGYPDGLPGKHIGDLTRIMTICDVYGALVERRAYKVAKSSQEAIDILAGMAKQRKLEFELVNALQRCVLTN